MTVSKKGVHWMQQKVVVTHTGLQPRAAAREAEQRLGVEGTLAGAGGGETGPSSGKEVGMREGRVSCSFPRPVVGGAAEEERGLQGNGNRAAAGGRGEPRGRQGLSGLREGIERDGF